MGDFNQQELRLGNFIEIQAKNEPGKWFDEGVGGYRWEGDFRGISEPFLEASGCCCCVLEPSNTRSISLGAPKSFELAAYILKIFIIFDLQNNGPYPIVKARILADRVIDSFRRLRIDNLGNAITYSNGIFIEKNPEGEEVTKEESNFMKDVNEEKRFILDFAYLGFVPYVDSVVEKNTKRVMFINAPFVRRSLR